jgi:hypothetical protein
VSSSCICGLRGAIFFLQELEEVGPEAALVDFLMPEEPGAFAWLGESLAPPTLGGSGVLGMVFVTFRLRGASVLMAPSPSYTSFMEESRSISWGDLHKVRD